MRTSSAAGPAAPASASGSAPTPSRTKTRLAPLWAGAGLAALVVIARLALHAHLPLPQCWLRQLTGIPCPSCGCTRSLAAWATLDLEQAFRFNPLFFLLCVAAIAWLALWVVERFTQRTFLEAVEVRLKRWFWWKL